jgi:DNA adenine methylase
VYFQLSSVLIENLSYEHIIKKYDRKHTCFYIDPPYFNCESDYGKEIFSRPDFPKMAELLSSMQGNFILSLNDRLEVRKIFSGFHFKAVEVRYSIASKSSKRKKFPELLISSLDFNSLK